MADAELLKSIGELLDCKLTVIKQQVDEKFDAFKQQVDEKFDAFKQQVDEKFDAFGREMDERFDAFEQKMDVKMDAKLQPIYDKLDSVDKRLARVEERVKNLELQNECEILPRLRTIESCYTSTYERYKKYCDRMDDVFNDVELLKLTVQKHSVKLQMIS